MIEIQRASKICTTKFRTLQFDRYGVANPEQYFSLNIYVSASIPLKIIQWYYHRTSCLASESFCYQWLSGGYTPKVRCQPFTYRLSILRNPSFWPLICLWNRILQFPDLKDGRKSIHINYDNSCEDSARNTHLLKHHVHAICNYCTFMNVLQTISGRLCSHSAWFIDTPESSSLLKHICVPIRA